MKSKRLLMLAVAVMLFCLAVHAAKKRQDVYVVSSVKGKVECITAKGKAPLMKGDSLTVDMVLNLPFDGSVTLLKQGDDKQIVINSPGKAKVGVLVADKRNTVLTLTKEYVKSVIGQLRKKPTVKAAYHSDPATVTREKMERDSLAADSCCQESHTCHPDSIATE